jgi:hypothetical protein
VASVAAPGGTEFDARFTDFFAAFFVGVVFSAAVVVSSTLIRFVSLLQIGMHPKEAHPDLIPLG